MSDFRRVIANAGWNLLGNVLPLLAAAVAMPFLVERIGTERFGLLSLSWVLIGYFGLFDFGLGRALTKMVAERVGGVADGELPALCSTGTALACAAGLAGGLIIAVAASWSDLWLASWPPALHHEAAMGLLVVAVGIPPTVATAALRGILEGLQRFKLLMLIRVPAGVLLFAAPCVSAWFTPRLDVAIATIVVTRWLVLLAHLLVCVASIDVSANCVKRCWIGPLLRFGGWLTVSNVVGPVIVYADRFIIGAMLSVTALAYYAAPFELVSRLLILPVALSGALFPALASAHERDLAKGRALRGQSLQLIFAIVFPIALLGGVFASPLLGAWLGAEFAEHGSRPMRILLVGFAFNALAQVPFAAMHGYGLARQTALLHLVELPLYGAALLILVRSHGLEGAAAAWTIRGVFDMLALSWLVHNAERRMPST